MEIKTNILKITNELKELNEQYNININIKQLIREYLYI